MSGRAAVPKQRYMKVRQYRRHEETHEGFAADAAPAGALCPACTVTNDALSAAPWSHKRRPVDHHPHRHPHTRHSCNRGRKSPPRWPLLDARSAAMTAVGLAPDDIDLLRSAPPNFRPGFATPSVAWSQWCRRRCALPKNRPALDINAACSVFSMARLWRGGWLTTRAGSMPLLSVRSAFPP